MKGVPLYSSSGKADQLSKIQNYLSADTNIRSELARMDLSLFIAVFRQVTIYITT